MTTRTIASDLERLAQLVGGRAWGAQQMKLRIYLDARRRDATIYFCFPDATYPTSGSADDPIDGVVCCLGGARLVVHIDECGQAPRWYESQRTMFARRFVRESLALAAASAEAWELAKQIMDLEDVESVDVDAIAHALANERVDEARRALEIAG